jgi:hypothetical protein
VIRIFLCGEGRTELGGRAGDPAYHDDAEPGVLVGLLRRVRADGWTIVGACNWSMLRKFRANTSGTRTPADARNVAIAALKAREAGADVLVFSRDEDGDADRSAAISRGKADASVKVPSVRVVGGLAVQCIEAWLLALVGERGTEGLHRARAKTQLEARAQDTATKVAIIDAADLDALPEDARSLRAWLADAHTALDATAP